MNKDSINPSVRGEFSLIWVDSWLVVREIDVIGHGSAGWSDAHKFNKFKIYLYFSWPIIGLNVNYFFISWSFFFSQRAITYILSATDRIYNNEQF